MVTSVFNFAFRLNLLMATLNIVVTRYSMQILKKPTTVHCDRFVCYINQFYLGNINVILSFNERHFQKRGFSLIRQPGTRAINTRFPEKIFIVPCSTAEINFSVYHVTKIKIVPYNGDGSHPYRTRSGQT